MQNVDADDVASPHSPLLENKEGIIAPPKSVPKLYVLRLLVIYGIFDFHYHLLQSALFVLPLVSSPHAPEGQYGSLHLCLYIIAVTLTAGLWLRLASPSAWGPKHAMMISIMGMFIFAIAVLIYLQCFIMSYTATCIVHLLNGLLGGNLVFVPLVYAQMAEVITRPLSRFAIFSFVLGLDFILTSSTDMVVFSLIGFTLNVGPIQVPAWIVCLLIPVLHIALVQALLPDTQTCLHRHVDHKWKPMYKAVATPLAELMTPKRLLVLSSALVIYLITQSPSPAHNRVEAPSFIFLFFTIQQIEFTARFTTHVER